MSELKMTNKEYVDWKVPAAKKQEGKTSLEPEPVDRNEDLQRHLQKYLGLNETNIGRIKLIEVKKLTANYKTQFDALQDKRLNAVTIAVIPDDLWRKRSQPSESSAENQLISIKQSYFEEQENPDEIAWLIHELAHCQSFLNFKSAEDYQKNMQAFAFEDLKTGYSYPNNPVEQYAFTKQFQFLKEQVKSRKDISKMLNEYYQEEDFPFFNRLLDSVYSK